MTLIGLIIGWYKIVRDPDVKADKNISTMRTTCTLKHERIDSDINEINKTLTLIQENHLRHMEDRLGKIEGSQIRIETILSERFKT